MPHDRPYRSYYANQLLRLYHAEEQVAGFVDQLVGEVSRPELEQVLRDEKKLLDRERLKIKRIYDRLGVQGEPRRAEAIVQAAREAERTVEDLDDLDPDLRDLEIIATLRQLKAQQESAIRALLTYAEAQDLEAEAREFQSMLQRENESDRRLDEVARDNLHDHRGLIGRRRPGHG